MNIGEMWKQLSVRTLTPGLEICDRCQQLATFYDEAGPEVRRMVQNFQAWSKEASTDVAQVAEKVRLLSFPLEPCCQYVLEADTV